MATLNDIARECGVSKATVSRVLNNDSNFSVSPQTRDQIMKTAAALNYNMRKKRGTVKVKPSVENSGNNANKTLKVGILSYNYPFDVDKEGNYYSKIFSSFISTLNNEAAPFHLEFRYTFKGSYEELYGLDALIVIGKLTLDPQHLIISSIRYKVFVDYASPDGMFDSVRINFSDVIHLAISYFHELGLFDIGYIGAYDHITQFPLEDRQKSLDPRHEAFENYCFRNNVDPDDHIWVAETFTSNEGYQLTNKIIQSGKLPPAVIFGSDEMALGGYKAFQEHGLKIGEDVSVIGIDNFSFADFLNPPLTTISLNVPLIGITAARALLSQIKGREYPLTIHPPIQLIKRYSCRGTGYNE